MFDLYRKKIVILLIILATGFSSEAQKRVNDVLHQQDYDEKIVHFGYFIGPNFARYDLKFNQQFQLAPASKQNPNYLITSPDVPGLLRFGGSVNFLVNDNFDFQTGLGASIYDRKIKSYLKADTTIFTAQEGNTAWLDFPAHLKFKSERRRNTRMYMMAGFRYSAEIAARTKKCGLAGCANIENKKKNDFMIEYGVGLEKFTPFAKITPELCFSHGLINLITTSSDPNRIGLTSMKSHTVTLFIYFE